MRGARRRAQVCLKTLGRQREGGDHRATAQDTDTVLDSAASKAPCSREEQEEASGVRGPQRPCPESPD